MFRGLGRSFVFSKVTNFFLRVGGVVIVGGDSVVVVVGGGDGVGVVDSMVDDDVVVISYFVGWTLIVELCVYITIPGLLPEGFFTYWPSV